MKKPQQDKPTTKSPPISLPPAMQLAANDTTLEQSSCNETSLYSADGSHLSQRTLAGGRFYCGEDTNNLEPVLRLATNIQSCLGTYSFFYFVELILLDQRKCNFPLIPHGRLLVGRLVGQSVAWLVDVMINEKGGK